MILLFIQKTCHIKMDFLSNLSITDFNLPNLYLYFYRTEILNNTQNIKTTLPPKNILEPIFPPDSYDEYYDYYYENEPRNYENRSITEVINSPDDYDYEIFIKIDENGSTSTQKRHTSFMFFVLILIYCIFLRPYYILSM